MALRLVSDLFSLLARQEACRRDLPLARARVAAVAVKVKNAASFGLSVRGGIDAIITLAYQPICNAEPQRDRGQAQQLYCAHAAKVENNDLSGNCEKSDKEHNLSLDNALLTLHDVLEDVIKLQ